MKYLLTSAFAVLSIALCSGSAVAQNHDDSIEDSWNRAARDNKAQQQRDDQYKWQAQQQQQQAPAPGQMQMQQPRRAWTALPPNPTNADYYNVNKSIIDSLTSLYCVSGTYLRTLGARNEAAYAASPAAPPPPEVKKDDGKFKYEKDNWKENGLKQQQRPPPTPDRNTEALRTLHQELLQLLDKCLNR